MSDSSEGRDRTAGGVLQPPVSLPPRIRRRRRRVRLPVVPAVPELELPDAPPGWTPREGLPPGGREQCRSGPRPCEYVRCSWHLWLVEGRDRPGRRRPGLPPPPSVLRAPSATSCALDIAEAVGRGERVTAVDVARALGITDRRLRTIVREAKRKLRQDPRARALYRELAGG